MTNSEVLLLEEVEQVAAPKPELGTILVVEDDPRMQKVLKRIFVEQSYSIEVAGDGKTGTGSVSHLVVRLQSFSI